LKTLDFYLWNVLAIAFPLALFEIWLERFKSGWDGEFTSRFWGKKIRIGFLNKVFEKAYITPYHFIMFGAIIPALMVVQYAWLVHLAGRNSLVMEFWDLKIVPLIFLPAVWLGNAVLEDFLWFALNWHFPDALRKLFRGEFKWHTKWVVVGKGMVPRFYLTTPGLVIVLLVLEDFIVKHYEN
jgi:hypothetical protein